MAGRILLLCVSYPLRAISTHCSAGMIVGLADSCGFGFPYEGSTTV